MKVRARSHRIAAISSKVFWPILLAGTSTYAGNVSRPVRGTHVEAHPPELEVRMFVISPVPATVLPLAAAEAERHLQSLHIGFRWLNCASPVKEPSCTAPDRLDVIQVRVLAHALPEASQFGLGMTMRSECGSSVALFFDRAVALRRPGVFLPHILGLAMAHEIGHILLPDGGHSHAGLMAPQWTSEQLGIRSSVYFGLSPVMAAQMLSEARRRVAAAAPANR